MSRSQYSVSMMVCFALAGTGCSAGSMGMDRGEVGPLPAEQAPVFDNAQIEQELGRRPQLPVRPRIAVVFRTPAAGEEESPPFRFGHEDRQALIGAAQELDVADVFPVGVRHIGNGSVEQIRLAAARHGADAVLIVDGSIEQEVSGNGWSATYALLVPILFAPGADLETMFRVGAEMVDVRNGYLYMTAEAEADDEQQRAHVWIDSEESTDESKLLAMQLLAEEIKTRLTAMIGRREAPEPAEPSPAEPSGEANPEPPAPDLGQMAEETEETTEETL